ncbi:MAG: hypothetical protein ABR555_09700 [Pyrinomonadaceae bacterium]
MTPQILRLIGLSFFFDAAVVAILNLHRVNLGLPWLPPALIVIGVVFLLFSARRRR